MKTSDNANRFGFRIVGSCHNERRLVDWLAAFVAYSQCDNRTELERESYLSAFCFGDDFRTHLDATGSTKGYSGECWALWLWFDIDRDDLELARRDAVRLSYAICDRFGLDADELLAFFSGSKGFHIGMPMTVCGSPGPSRHFAKTCRRFAERVAEVAGVAIDSGVYDVVRAFRTPNSKHPKTGLHKRRFELDAVEKLKLQRLCEMSQTPEPFELPDAPKQNQQAVDNWLAAIKLVEQETVVATEKRTTRNTGVILNRSTFDFIRDGATTGDRHRLLFSAAANLAEFGCSFDLAYALLGEVALDSGLSPSDVRRQIQCGLEHQRGIL